MTTRLRPGVVLAALEAAQEAATKAGPTWRDAGPWASWPRERVHRFADADHPHPCRLWHSFCSTVDGGPCLDEVLTAHEAADPRCPLCDRLTCEFCGTAEKVREYTDAGDAWTSCPDCRPGRDA